MFLYLQVAFNHFYNTSGPSEKCTLYAGRNHINRRNVSFDVENLSACKQFFIMEIESRVLAATLDFMEITSLDDSSSDNVLPSSLHNSPAPVQQKFLKDLASNVVDTYIVNEVNINNLKKSCRKSVVLMFVFLPMVVLVAGFLVAQSLLPLMERVVSDTKRPMVCTHVLQLCPCPTLLSMPRTMFAVISSPFSNMACYS